MKVLTPTATNSKPEKNKKPTIEELQKEIIALRKEVAEIKKKQKGLINLDIL
jgi:hypothetical protein